MTANDVAYQLTPRGKHSRNSSEKEIQTWKYHFLSGMVSTHTEFTLSQWCKLFEQGNITLKLLRPSKLNPKISAYAQVFGNSHYQKTTLPPSGIKVLSRVLPINRRSFDLHAIKGLSIVVSMEHYR